MAAPLPVFGASTFTASGTSIDVPYPASVAAGDRLQILVVFDGAGDAPTATGFTAIASPRAHSTADNGGLYVLEKVAAGGESGTVTVTITGGLESIAGVMLRWPAASIDAGTATAVAENSPASSTAAPDPPSLTVPWGSEDNRFLAIAGWDGGRTLATYPTSYADTQGNEDSDTATSGFGLAWASRALTTATENPGTFGISASDQWATVTLSVRGSTGGGELESASVTATGGGAAVLAGSGRELAGRSITATGGGAAVASGSASDPPELESASITATGGGVATLARTGRELAGRSITATGGGVAVVTGSEFVAPPPGCEIDGVYWDLRAELSTGWTSWSALLLSATWRWGPSSPLGPLTMPTAGQATAVLIDTERLFDPLNQDSTLAGELRFGLPVQIAADDAPVFTGALAGWSHDQRTHTAVLTIDGPLAELGRLDPPATLELPEAPSPPALDEGIVALTHRDIVEWALTEIGWPSSRLVFLDNPEPWILDPIGINEPGGAPGDPTLVDVLDPMSFLQARALSALALVSEGRDGSIRWRGVVDFTYMGAGGGVPPVINCEGVDVDDLVGGMTRDRVRNAVRIEGTPLSGEWDPLDPLDPTPTFVDAASIAEHGRRLVRTTVDELRIGPAVIPYGEGADPTLGWWATNAGLHLSQATAYEFELWELDDDASPTWDLVEASGVVGTMTPIPDPLPYAQLGGEGAFTFAFWDPDHRYRWRIRYRYATNTWTPWMGAEFTTGSRDLLADPAAYEYWSWMVLAALGTPRPLTITGTLRPKTPAEVADIARAEAGDRWLVVHNHVSPTILRHVRVLGESCRLGPFGLEVDAITEELNEEDEPV